VLARWGGRLRGERRRPINDTLGKFGRDHLARKRILLVYAKFSKSIDYQKRMKKFLLQEPI